MHSIGNRLRIALWTAIFAVSTTVSFAQMNVAQISGLVTDPAGDVVPGVSVIATNTATGLKFNALTNDSGQYLLTQLAPGSILSSASAAGFKQSTRENVALHAGEQMALQFSMVIGERAETVIVEESAGLLQTESAQIKDVIENQQVVDLPVKDREFLELALLGSGVVNPPGGTRGDSLQQTGKLINILGQRTGHNLFLVDGVSVTDEYFNNVVLNPSPDAIREFNIAKTDYDAEFGGKSGGVINVITQSGTNSFHGSVYEFLRNNVFDARNFFAPPNQPAPFRENQFGAALGGPIARDKTFFFLNYDGQRIRDSVAQLFSVPTAAQRAGVFTTPIVNPATRRAVSRTTRSTCRSIRRRWRCLRRFHCPTFRARPTIFSPSDEQTNDNNQYNARLDHQFSAQDSAYARASVFTANEFDPFGSSVLNEALLPGFGRNLTTHSVNASAGRNSHRSRPTSLNEFRFGFLRVSGGQGDPNAGTPFAAQYGLRARPRIRATWATRRSR